MFLAAMSCLWKWKTDSAVIVGTMGLVTKIIQPQHKIVEWSASRCDNIYTYAAVEKADFTHLMPSVEDSVLCIQPLRKTMPGLFSFSLPILLYMIYPKSPSAFNAHEAPVDTLMFFIVKLISALMYYGRKGEFLTFWENYHDEPGAWTERFIEHCEKKPIEAQSDSPALTLSAILSKKYRLESGGNSKASKKAIIQSDKSKSQLAYCLGATPS